MKFEIIKSQIFKFKNINDSQMWLKDLFSSETKKSIRHLKIKYLNALKNK
jgi:hypothetical protein